MAVVDSKRHIHPRRSCWGPTTTGLKVSANGSRSTTFASGQFFCSGRDTAKSLTRSASRISISQAQKQVVQVRNSYSPIRFDDKSIWEKQAHLVDPSETCLSMPIEFFDSTRPGQNRVYVDKQAKYGSISDGLHFARRLYLAPSLRQRTYKDHKPSDTPHIVWEVRFASLFTPSYLLDMGELGSWS